MRTLLLPALLFLLAPASLPGQSARAQDYGRGSTQFPVSGPAWMPLPPYSSTYSYRHTRGFWCRVPCPLVILGWEVPDEQKHGKMHVAFYRMKAAPPKYSASRPETPLFFRAGAASGRKVMLKPPLMFKPGDYLGVLGACGPDTRGYLLNSYGRGGFRADIGCGTVTLNRLLMQAPITTNKGVGALSSGGTGSIGRVKLEIVRTVLPALTTTALPRLGATGSLEVKPGLPGALAGVVALGRGRINLPLPQCTLLAGFPYLLLFSLPGGAGKVNLPIPADPVLAGAGPVNFQGFLLAPGNFGGTNGVEWFLGR